ncbi:hypothetical protein YPPY66_4773, partial [Yersinia pestis PY-66]|jgi:hypothetical protein
MEAV